MKKTIESEINEFLEVWDYKSINNFFNDVMPLIELYDVEPEDDWVKDLVGEEDERNVRLIRTVYLMSRIAEFHSSKLCTLKIRFKDLWLRMEKKEIVAVEIKS